VLGSPILQRETTAGESSARSSPYQRDDIRAETNLAFARFCGRDRQDWGFALSYLGNLGRRIVLFVELQSCMMGHELDEEYMAVWFGLSAGATAKTLSAPKARPRRRRPGRTRRGTSGRVGASLTDLSARTGLIE
jgi:hypothetical protein